MVPFWVQFWASFLSLPLLFSFFIFKNRALVTSYTHPFSQRASPKSIKPTLPSSPSSLLRPLRTKNNQTVVQSRVARHINIRINQIAHVKVIDVKILPIVLESPHQSPNNIRRLELGVDTDDSYRPSLLHVSVLITFPDAVSETVKRASDSLSGDLPA